MGRRGKRRGLRFEGIDENNRGVYGSTREEEAPSMRGIDEEDRRRADGEARSLRAIH